MEIADWIYEEVAADSPMVLTMHPRHFRIEQGIGCFVYRLAQISAGRTDCAWKFQRLFERSNSAGTFKEFCRMRPTGILRSNDLPDYTIEDRGSGGTDEADDALGLPGESRTGAERKSVKDGTDNAAPMA
jgi:plasmid replication initiation protein